MYRGKSQKVNPKKFCPCTDYPPPWCEGHFISKLQILRGGEIKLKECRRRVFWQKIKTILKNFEKYTILVFIISSLFLLAVQPWVQWGRRVVRGAVHGPPPGHPDERRPRQALHHPEERGQAVRHQEDHRGGLSTRPKVSHCWGEH